MPLLTHGLRRGLHSCAATRLPLRGCAVRAFSQIQHQANNLSVTGTTTGDVTHADLAVGGLYFSDPNLILRDQVSTERILIGESAPIHANWIAARWLLITHVENLITRSEILPGVAMAAQAPLHLERCVLIHKRHLVDRA